MKSKKVIDAPDFAEKSSPAVRMMERKKLEGLLAEQRSYERNVEQLRQLKLEEGK